MADGGVGAALAVALLLGLRHATDPDHLTAVSALVLDDARHGTRRARRLGLCWGLGHAVTLVAFGLPIVLLGRRLPEAVQKGAEAAIGLIIVVLAVRLLLRWRRGAFHVHPHAHGGVWHAHPHAHARDHGAVPTAHDHSHAEALGRSPLVSFGIGLVHGIGGSAGAGLLVVAAFADPVTAGFALLVFAAGTGVSMAAVTWMVGGVVGHGAVAGRVERLVPVLGTAALLFGIWYAFGRLSAPSIAIPY